MTEEAVRARGNVLGRFVPARYILAFLGSIGMAIIYGLKVNLSVAMVAMLNHTAIKEMENNMSSSTAALATKIVNSTVTKILDTTFNMTSLNVSSSVVDEVCSSGDSAGVPEDGPFVWNSKLQGTLLSCYFWGYLVSQVPAAKVAASFSAKWVMFFSIAINVVATILTPPFTKLHYSGLIILRVLEGIGGGATFPAMHSLLATWAPPNERSVMSTITYVGTSLGTALSILLSGVFAAAYGWESVFYIMGGLSIVWMLMWAILIQDNPNKQPFISREERDYINSELGQKDTSGDEKKPPVPWRKVFTSVPFLAILIAHSCSNWGWYMFLIEIPFYMKQVLHFNVSSNAVASAIPYFPMLIASIFFSKILDTLKSKGKITTTIARKIATSFCTIIPGICLLSLCYIGCKHTAAVVIMSIGIVAMGGMFSGFLSNHIDIAPNYAGTLVAITNTVATVPGIIVPLFVGVITDGNQTIGAWRVIFFVTIVLFAIEFLVFTTFGSGEEQSWNKPAKLRKNTQDQDSERSEEIDPLQNGKKSQEQ